MGFVDHINKNTEYHQLLLIFFLFFHVLFFLLLPFPSLPPALSLSFCWVFHFLYLHSPLPCPTITHCLYCKSSSSQGCSISTYLHVKKVQMVFPCCRRLVMCVYLCGSWLTFKVIYSLFFFSLSLCDASWGPKLPLFHYQHRWTYSSK